MPITNNLKKQVDQPVFEWLRPVPQITSGSSVTASSYKNARFIYYAVSTTNAGASSPLWRYDTYTDSWQELLHWKDNLSPLMTMKGLNDIDFFMDVISATSTTIQIGGFGPNYSRSLIGKKIHIVDGRGAGQIRTITDVSTVTVHSYYLYNRNLYRFEVNQWRGYSGRCIFGTYNGPGGPIQYNSRFDTLIGPVYGGQGGFGSPIAFIQAGDNINIESVNLTLDSPWSVIPDKSSLCSIPSEGLYLNTSTGFGTMVKYSEILGSYAGTSNLQFLPFTPSTDYVIEPTYRGNTSYITGFTASSASSNSIVCSGITFSYDRWANYELSIVSGAGVGQKRRIVGNNDTRFFVDRKWKVIPNSTSIFEINNDYEKTWCVTSSLACLAIVSNIYGAQSSVSHIVDFGMAKNISVTLYAGASYGTRTVPYTPDQRDSLISSAATVTYSASGVLDVSVNTAGGTYQIGDLVTLTTTGTNAQAYVTGISGNGAVTSVQLAFSGAGYTSGTSNTSGGSGSGLILGITAGRVGNVTTIRSIGFNRGDVIKIEGCTTDSSFNNNFSIIGINSQNTFSIANPSGSASPTALNSQSTTTLVDASQNWNTNQHVGRILNGVGNGRRITANTATTITVAGSAITTPTDGTVRYTISEPRGFGAMVTSKTTGTEPYGWATSGTATTLVDTTKTWRPNQWLNCRVRVMCGTGEGNGSVITSNTSNTLTVASWGVATPDATSKYEIMDSFGVVTTAGTTTLTDANKNWEPNALVGKRVRIIAGSGVGNEATITANTATVLTLSASITTASSSGDESCYTIYEIPIRSTGINLIHAHGLSNPNNRGRWLISPRGGGSNLIDIYDIPSNTWILSPFLNPTATTLTTGSMYAYDGEDTLLFTKESTGRIYALDLNTFTITGSTIIPYTQNTAVVGQRMNVIKTEDGLTYLYIMRHTGQEFWRTLKFW